jgi:hypothetical protein
MRVGLIFVALTLTAIAGNLPNDTALRRLLVGTWHSYRHDTQYRADGTWVMDPPDEGTNTRGKWRIEQGKLIETWRFEGESSDSSSVDEIIELTEKTLRFRTLSQDGPGRPEGLVLPSGVYTLIRVDHDDPVHHQ